MIRLNSIFLLASVAGAVSPLAGFAGSGQTPLATTAVSGRLVNVEHRLDGVVEAVNQATMTAEIPGRVAEVLFDVGDVVPADAVVLRFRGTEQKAEVTQAEAQVRDAEARVVETRRNFERLEALYAEKATSLTALDQARATLEVSEASLQASKASLTKAQERAGYTVIRAPYGGVVTQRHVEQGESVSAGQPLISGFLPDQLRVVVEIPQRLIESVRGGGKALAYLPGNSDKPLEISGISIFPYANAGTGTIRARLDLPQATSGVMPGMLVKVSFVVDSRPVLVIAERAIVHRSEVAGVYVVTEDNEVNLRRIRPGRRLADGNVVVLAGLQQGERVAMEPAEAVKHLRKAESATR